MLLQPHKTNGKNKEPKKTATIKCKHGNYEVVCEMKNYWFSVLVLFVLICATCVYFVQERSSWRSQIKSVEKVCSTSITVKLKRLLIHWNPAVTRFFRFCLYSIFHIHTGALDLWWLFRLNRRHLNKILTDFYGLWQSSCIIALRW